MKAVIEYLVFLHGLNMQVISNKRPININFRVVRIRGVELDELPVKRMRNWAE
jgi:hypothetical protein